MKFERLIEEVKKDERDEDILYEIAFRTAQAFEDFKHIYYSYLEKVARDES